MTLTLVRSKTFADWLNALGDRNAKTRIAVRLDRLALGNPGDVKPIGEGLSEMRIDYGPGYRVYYMQRGIQVIVLLCGGDKRTQDKDIGIAKAIAAQWLDDS